MKYLRNKKVASAVSQMSHVALLLSSIFSCPQKLGLHCRLPSLFPQFLLVNCANIHFNRPHYRYWHASVVILVVVIGIIGLLASIRMIAELIVGHLMRVNFTTSTSMVIVNVPPMIVIESGRVVAVGQDFDSAIVVGIGWRQLGTGGGVAAANVLIIKGVRLGQSLAGAQISIGLVHHLGEQTGSATGGGQQS